MEAENRRYRYVLEQGQPATKQYAHNREQKIDISRLQKVAPIKSCGVDKYEFGAFWADPNLGESRSQVRGHRF